MALVVCAVGATVTVFGTALVASIKWPSAAPSLPVAVGMLIYFAGWVIESERGGS